ncbi:MAG: YggU family protein [Euryarchaeota archaeon]|nr:YggU family protein [Euryarchaeota archaeon]
MALSTVLRTVQGGTEIDIMVTPNAKEPSIGEVDEWRHRLAIKVRAVPSEGRANREVCKLLQDILGQKVEILRGALDRHKTIMVPLEEDEVREKLEEALAQRR